MCYCIDQGKVILLRKMFRGWERVVRMERIAYWEKERRARKHRERYGQLGLTPGCVNAVRVLK